MGNPPSCIDYVFKFDIWWVKVYSFSSYSLMSPNLHFKLEPLISGDKTSQHYTHVPLLWSLALVSPLTEGWGTLARVRVCAWSDWVCDVFMWQDKISSVLVMKRMGYLDRQTRPSMMSQDVYDSIFVDQLNPSHVEAMRQLFSNQQWERLRHRAHQRVWSSIM